MSLSEQFTQLILMDDLMSGITGTKNIRLRICIYIYMMQQCY